MKKKYTPKEIGYLVLKRLPDTALGKLRGNLVRVHWGRGLNNFGDCLQPYILRHYGFTPVYCPQARSDVVLCGSILQWLPKDYKGIIIGTGGEDIKYEFSQAKVVGVRGHRTLRNFPNGAGGEVVGDPGLIMNKVFPGGLGKKYKLGLVPHFADRDHPIVRLWMQKFGPSCAMIDVLRPVPEVIEGIKSCEYILSSSLHGLVVADAFCIPNRRFVIRGSVPAGFYDYKYNDYCSSLGTIDNPIEASGSESLGDLIASARTHPDEVNMLQEKLDSIFKNLHFLLTENR